MRTDLFDFELPDERTALEPVQPRDARGRLVVRPAEGRGTGLTLADRYVPDLPSLLRAGDVLVLDDARVIPAALTGERRRGEHAATVSFNLHKRLDESRWLAFARPAK